MEMEDELEMCKEALSEIASICESYKGLVPRDEKPATEIGEPAAIEVQIEAGPEEVGAPDEESMSEPEPLSVIERPADREQRRGRGRPRKVGY